MAEYGSQDDHHVGRLDVRLATSTNANTVTVEGSLGVRDWSGSWDDTYDGIIEFVVLAELQSASEPPPRADLAITGLELNQATQFFRASSYLDSANAHPDNSVFPIAGKNTGVRVYVDWDAGAGLPPISQLSGELILNNGVSSTTLAPINPGGSITPKRDATINQALSNDTLNFMIPGALASGTVSVTCRVFDQTSPSAGSTALTRTLVFVAVEPLNIYLVGVATLQPAAPAPTQSAVAGALSLLRQTYPRGFVQATGFTTTTLASQIVGQMPSSGCGTGWSDLLDILRDLKGDSDDIYFGGLPAGIFAAGVVGCSPTGDRVAASFIDLLPTVPHEVGHSLGRQHAPCQGCSPAAQNPDEDFPQYGSFNSDSIGVFGFDPTTNTVFNPANTLDFMTAFLPGSAWISPYTYRALLGTIQGGPSPASATTYRGGLRMTLFLRLSISRGREVIRDCSFTYPAPLQGNGCETEFEFDLLDGDGEVLDCGPLRCPCNETGCGCWPKHIRSAIPMPEGVRSIRIREADEEIYREEIPEPPELRITSQESRGDGVHLEWKSNPRRRGTKEEACYLVQVQDSGGETYRGLTARSSDTTAVIPRRLFTRGSKLNVRVLASSGIATSIVESTVELQDYEAPDVELHLGVTEAQRESDQLPAVVSLLAVDSAGREVSPDRVAWYGSGGNQIGRGGQLDLRSLPMGTSRVRAVVHSHGGRTVGKSWLVERSGASFARLASVTDPERTSRVERHKHPNPRPKMRGDQSGGE
jgi:hypothetical protein